MRINEDYLDNVAIDDEETASTDNGLSIDGFYEEGRREGFEWCMAVRITAHEKWFEESHFDWQKVKRCTTEQLGVYINNIKKNIDTVLRNSQLTNDECQVVTSNFWPNGPLGDLYKQMGIEYEYNREEGGWIPVDDTAQSQVYFKFFFNVDRQFIPLLRLMSGIAQAVKFGSGRFQVGEMMLSHRDPSAHYGYGRTGVGYTRFPLTSLLARRGLTLNSKNNEHYSEELFHWFAWNNMCGREEQEVYQLILNWFPLKGRKA